MTDHKKEAEELARPSTNYYNGGQTVAESYPSEKKLAAAQVHATLYLAEQQRIANLIAVLPLLEKERWVTFQSIKKDLGY